MRNWDFEAVWIAQEKNQKPLESGETKLRLSFIALLTIPISLFSVASYSDDIKALSQWSSKCSLGKIQLRFEAQSKSGDPYEDDMTARIQIGKKSLRVPIGTGLLWPMDPPKEFAACDKIVAIQTNKNQLVLLFAIDNRPTLDQLAAILIDTGSGDILDVSKNLGGFFRVKHENRIQINKTESGFRALVAQGWNRSAKTDSAQEILMGWINVRANDGRILARWEKPLPPTHSPYSNPDVLPALTR